MLNQRPRRPVSSIKSELWMIRNISCVLQGRFYRPTVSLWVWQNGFSLKGFYCVPIALCLFGFPRWKHKPGKKIKRGSRNAFPNNSTSVHAFSAEAFDKDFRTAAFSCSPGKNVVKGLEKVLTYMALSLNEPWVLDKLSSIKPNKQ